MFSQNDLAKILKKVSAGLHDFPLTEPSESLPMEISSTQDIANVGAASQKIDVECLRQIVLAVKTEADELNETDSSDQLQKISSALLNFRVTVGFVGLTNSGKSTILNALLGFKFLPSSLQRQSVCPVCIKHDSQSEDPKCPGKLYGLAKTKKTYLASGVQSIRESISEMNESDRLRKATEYDELILHAPIACLSESQHEITNFDLYDIAGVSEGNESIATACANKSLRDSAAIILVIGADTVSTNDLTDLVERLKKDHPNIIWEKHRMCVLINKYDMCYEDDDTDNWDPKTLSVKIAEQTGVPPEQIEYCCAKLGLISRQWRHDKVTKEMYKRGYGLLSALSNPPVEEDIDSMVVFSPANVAKLTDILERFSRIRKVETRLLKNIFNSDLVVLLKSSGHDCIGEISKLKDAIIKKKQGLTEEISHQQSLIQQIENFLNKHCKFVVSGFLDKALQSYQEKLKADTKVLKQSIDAETSRAAINLLDIKEDLETQIKTTCDHLRQLAELEISKLWGDCIGEIKTKLTTTLRDLLSSLKQYIANTHPCLTSQLNFDSIHPGNLVESLSFLAVKQPAECFEKTHLTAMPITAQNDKKEKKVISLFIIGPKCIFFGEKSVPYTDLVSHETQSHKLDTSGFTRTFDNFTSNCVTYICDNLGGDLKKQTNSLMENLSTQLLQMSTPQLTKLKENLKSMKQKHNQLEQKIKLLDNKAEELSCTLNQLLSQQGLNKSSFSIKSRSSTGKPVAIEFPWS